VLEIVDAERQLARVMVMGVPRTVNLSMLDGDDRAGIGDWVVIYTGFAMSKIDEAEALQTQQMLDGEEEAYADYAAVTAQIHEQMSTANATHGEADPPAA
jgi:hydrogenase expression/formation protein HypC